MGVAAGVWEKCVRGGGDRGGGLCVNGMCRMAQTWVLGNTSRLGSLEKELCIWVPA